ncbi:unnamed protein product [Adineta steineri]|uniref:G-protein coupled receptors family 1 profile domain-containing protein n=1 Tax=Adineta steineri TaxID=433720 RepID=A0A819K8F2_9BILA|nr:unnamed protein product [Adineta steineri]CAF3944837.1 unnamed protein product [Adineta steineri]
MSSTSPLTAIFANIHLQLSRYVYCPLYIAGNLGNIFSLIMFSQAKLRSSGVCSWYFLVVSVANLISINTGFITRILSYMGFPDPSRTIGWYCTGRIYISNLSLTMARYFLCSIVIDRFLITSTNVKFRRMSSFKVAKWYIPLSILGWMIYYSNIWVGYNGYQNGSACKRQDGVYTIFITVNSLTIDTSIPILLMTIFSLLTLNNLCGLRRRRNLITPHIDGSMMTVVRTTNRNETIDGGKQKVIVEQREKKQFGKQLTMISLIQVLLYIMLNVLSAIYALYSVITSSTIRTPNRTAIESFINAIAVMMTFIFGTVS